MKHQMRFNFDETMGPSVIRPISTSSISPTGGEQTYGKEVPSPPPAVPTVTRPIHYLGSKLRIVGLVREIVNSVDPSRGPVCDLFAGSGTVSRELSNTRTVIAVDIQEYSRVLCSALLNPAKLEGKYIKQFLGTALASEHAGRLKWAVEPLANYEASCRHQAEGGEAEPLCRLLESGSLISFEEHPELIEDTSVRKVLREAVLRMRDAGLTETPGALASRYFGGIYFSYTQAAQIDMLLEGVQSLTPSARDTVLAAVLSTASEVVNTVGKQFAQPIRPRLANGAPKPQLAKRVARDRDADVIEVFQRWIMRYLSLPRSERNHRVIRSDYRDALPGLHGQVTVVYADPPYTRDHYSRFYHVLETLSLRDCPAVSKVRINGTSRLSRGVYRVPRHQSPFCIKTKAPNAFSCLFAAVRRLDVPLVVSYSPYEKGTTARPRLMTVTDIARLAQKSFRRVEALTAGGMAHSKLNRSDLNKGKPDEAETFLVCEP